MSTNIIANTSYVNKDFQDVYPELLDLAKALGSKWDPSISNESDPGVVLIKLNAIIADKLNYNIDKNVLECFPLSVTQYSNARQLFEQLGYYMHWYKGATCNVSMKWIGDTSDTTYEIPQFTMVSDYDGSIVYTLVGPATNTTANTFNVGSQTLSCNGTILTFKAIQGVATTYDINGETLITPSMLDSNNRLYFTDTTVAENGIFITNSEENNYSSWIKKDNLLVEELGNNYYKFGVTQDGSSCYIEFPEDAETIFKEGIYITYIKTDGINGNISARTLEKFYNDFTVGGTTLTVDNTLIANYSAAGNGADIEDIDDAYKNYQRTIGTFNTLITLRDYINTVITSGLVSNGFVCDRTNDIQLTYKVASAISDTTQDITVIEQGLETYDTYSNQRTYSTGARVTYNGVNYVCIQAITFPETWEPTHWSTIPDDANATPKLSAFDLKLYLLQYMDSTYTATDYNKSFGMLSNSELSNIQSYLNDIKSINHDFKQIVTPNYVSGNIKDAHFCYFKNKYPVKCTIIPQYNLTNTQASEIISNIKKALFTNLNSSKVDFGGKVDFDMVHNVIINADNRIKNISLNTLSYVTYAVYWNGTSYVEVQINGDGVDLTDPVVTKFRAEIYAKSVLAGVTPFFIKDEEYDYKLNQLTSRTITNIEMIGSDLAVELNKETDNSGATIVDNTVRTLGTNETVQFYTPNLVDTTSYSNYVKYEYRFINSVTANESYQLRANEWVILYWKEQDTDDAVYKYYAYGEGNIIRPTFDMLATGLTSTLYGEELLIGKRNVGTVTYPCWESSSDYNSNMSSSLSTIIKDNLLTDNTLSGTKSITKRIINEVTLDNSYFCYWILNSKTNDGKYRLFSVPEQYSGLNTYVVGDEVFYNNVPYKCIQEISIPEPTFVPSHWLQMVEQSRILSTGEYFFYSNKSLSDLIILGVGTEITRTIFNTNWDVTAGDSATILEQGITALDSLWFTIPSNTTINVVENQYVSLAEGYQLKMSTNSPKNIYNINYVVNPESTVQGFTVSWTETDPAHYRDLWFTQTGGIVGNYPFAYTGGQWRTTGSRIVTLESYGIQISVAPQEGMLFNIYVYDTWTAKYTSSSGLVIVLPDGNLPRCGIASMSDFTIMYKHSNDAEWVKLEDVSLITHNTWSTRSLLTINTSQTQEQVLLKNQNLNYKVWGESSYNSILGENLTEGYIYVCDGTETGKRHFKVNGSNYSFTVPSGISAYDKFIFVASSKYLYLNSIGGTRITTTGGTQGADITNSLVVISFYPTCILTSFEFETEGGEYVYSYTYDEAGNIKYLGIYQYGKIVSSDTNVRYSDNSALCDFNATTTESSLYFSLPDGTYVIPLKHLSLVDVTSLQVKLDGVTLSDTKLVTDFKNQGTYFLTATLTGGPKIRKLQVISQGQTVSYTVTIGNFYKYSKSDDLTPAEFEAILAKVTELNTNGGNYDFSIQIDSDKVIKNPLDPEQFLNTNHIYNPFTICQLDTSSNTNLQIQGLK